MLSIFKKYLLSGKNRKILFFLALIIINLIVFYPSFFHVARHDQLQYIGDAAKDTSWVSLAIKRGFSYNRNTHIFLGFDPALFRPLFYLILGSELWLFRYNFILWQIAGLLFHLFALWNLLSLLWRIRPGLFAWALTLFFSVLYTNIEMVIWHHISSYMLFLGCVLLCLRVFYEILDENTISTRQTWTLFFALLCACLVYDLGFLCSLFFFVFSKFFLNPQTDRQKWIPRNWRLAILLPAMIYLILNALSLAMTWQTIATSQYKVGSLPLLKTIHNFFISFYWWTTSGLFPTFLKVVMAQRIIFYYNYIFLNIKGAFLPPHVFSLGFLSALSAIVTCLIILYKGMSRNLLMHRWKFLALITGVWFLQMAVIVVGRINPDGMDILANYSYYNYLFWAYPLIILYALIDFQKLSIKIRYFNLRNFSLAFLCLLIAINTKKTFGLNIQYAKTCQSQRIIVEKTRKLIKEHSQEKDFSFAVNDQDNFYVSWMYKVPPVPSEQPYAYMQILYPSLYDKNNPKYLVSLTEQERKNALVASLEAMVEEPPVDLQPSDLKSFLFLLEIYIMDGKKDKALRLIQKISSLNIPDDNLKAYLAAQKERTHLKHTP